jgi:hypothetical protein
MINYSWTIDIIYGDEYTWKLLMIIFIHKLNLCTVVIICNYGCLKLSNNGWITLILLWILSIVWNAIEVGALCVPTVVISVRSQVLTWSTGRNFTKKCITVLSPYSLTVSVSHSAYKFDDISEGNLQRTLLSFGLQMIRVLSRSIERMILNTGTNSCAS